MSLLLGWPDIHAGQHPVGFGAAPPAPIANRPVTDPSNEGHWLCVAPTGAGKSAAFAVPQLLSYPGGIVAVDVKGELAAITARYRRTLGPVLVFDPFQVVAERSGCFNPLSHLDRNDPQLVDDAYTLAQLLSNHAAPSQNTAPDRFWDDWGQDVIAALIIHAVHAEDATRRTLGEVYRRFHADDPVYHLACLLDNEQPHAFTRGKLGALVGLPEVTRGGVLATAGQQLRMLAGQGVSDAFAGNSIDLGRLGSDRPVTIYLVLPPERLGSHGGVIRLALTALLQRLFRRRHRPQHPTLLLVDEAAQLGVIPALQAAITLGRGYGVRAALLVQSLAQLRSTYGTACETLIENCALMTMGKHAAFSMARQLAEQGFGDVSPETLFALSREDVMIRAYGERTRRLRKLDYRTDGLFDGRFDPNPFYENGSRQPELALFD